MDEHPEHRSTDEVLAAHILSCEEVQRQILLKLAQIESHQAEMLEIIMIYRNTRGFVATAKVIAIVTIGISAFGAALAAIGFAVKEWLRP